MPFSISRDIVKNLNVWIHKKFKLKHHVEKPCWETRQILGLLNRNRSSFPVTCENNIVAPVFLSVLDYGGFKYGHAAGSPLRPLNFIYHSAPRFITGDKCNTHHGFLLYMIKLVGLPCLKDVITTVTDTMCVGKLQSYISSLLLWHFIFNTFQ